MVISELSAGQGNVNVEGAITEVGEIKNFNKFGRELKVANAILKDDSGTIKLTLWNDEASKFKEGDKVKIENGYVNEFQGEPQLTAGKYGKIEKVGEGEVEAKAGEDSEQEELPSDGDSDEAPSEGEEAPTEEEKVGSDESESAAEETKDSEDF
jgi:replication factor A1